MLDFGLAKAFSGDTSNSNLSQSPTLSMAATRQGIILGTAAYMSPEQARGLAVDKRADIWAFGAVLFEMLTSRQVFAGYDASLTLARVLEREPEFDSLPTNLNPRIRELLERCLEKEARNRWHDIADVRVDVEKTLVDPRGSLVEPEPHVARAGSRPGLLWIAGIVLLATTVGALGMWAFRPTPERPITRFAVEPPTLAIRIGGSSIALSPDGRRIVYEADGQLHLRVMEQMEARPIPGTEGGQDPFFSPNGESLGFSTEGQLKTMVLPAGAPVPVADVIPTAVGGTWGTEGQIIFGQSGDFGLSQVLDTGGAPEPFAVLGDALDVDYPNILPGGEWVVFTERVSPRWSGANIVAQSAVTGERRLLIPGGHRAQYASTGHLVYAREGALLAVGFDADSVEVVTPPVVLVEGVSTNERGGAAQFALSDNGTLAYLTGIGSLQNRALAMVGIGGGVERLNAPPAIYLSPRLSPDGTTLAVQSFEEDGAVIWTYDLSDDRQIQQLTFDGSNIRPIWTPDGERITFASNLFDPQNDERTMSLYWQPADGSTVAERLTTAEEGTAHWPGSWSPDGQVLSFMVQSGSDWDIWTLSVVDGEYKTEPLYDVEGRRHRSPEFSPDGRWLAYASGGDIYVEPFPPTGRRERISRDGGSWVVWSRQGDQLFYRSGSDDPRSIRTTTGSRLSSVDIETEPDFSFSNEQLLPLEGFNVVSLYRDYDITPDGERFVMVVPEDESNTAANASINIVMNWFEELAERVPVQ